MPRAGLVDKRERARRRALRRRCEERLQQLDLPEPVNADDVVTQLARRRGRPIRVLSLPGSPGGAAPCGLWLAREDEDWIFVEAGTSPLHREHILFHELAHIVCGHDPRPDGEGQISGLLRNLDLAMVRRVLGRTNYTDDEEQEAELLASLILSRCRSASPSSAAHLQPDVSRVIDRTTRALRGRDG